MERYGAAKARCLRLQDSSDTAVLNADDSAVMGIARSTRASLSLFGRKPLEELLKNARNAASIDESGSTGPVVRASIDGAVEVYPTSRSALLGAHNRANVAAAVLAVRAMGVAPAAIQEAIDTFAPLEHRLEVVSRDGGRIIINDSKSTTVAASLAAFSTIRGHFPEHKLVLMLGGLSKAGSWEPLLKAVVAEKKAIEPVVCFGKDGPLLAGHCRASGVPCVVAPTLREGTMAALEALQAVERGIVLLTPGCASFDEFTDFEHRGAQFKSYVAGARPVPLSA
jgi:UDP-N-acetylmuramoylalanine--D-glutamate ligase